MSRAIITAAVARDLAAEFGGNVVRIRGATNGVLQAWDTFDREFYLDLADPGIVIYTRRVDVPNAIRNWLVMVRASAVNLAVGSLAWDDLGYTVWANVPVGAFVRVRNGVGPVVVKTRGTLVAGDRPVDWTTVHDWQGIADDLGDI